MFTGHSGSIANVHILSRWQQGIGIQGDWCTYSIYAVYGCLVVFREPHQWWWALLLWSLLGKVSSPPFMTSEEVMRKTWEACSYIDWDLFPVTLVGRLRCVPGHNNVPDNDTYLFCHNDGSLLHIRIILWRLLCSLLSSWDFTEPFYGYQWTSTS